MDSEIVYLTLAALSFAVALNLKLTLAVLRTGRRERDLPDALLPGQSVPAVTARAFSSRARLQLAGGGQAAVLLFLSSKCPKCRERLPEVERMIPAAEQAGLAMWIVSEESPWRLRAFLRSSSLLSVAARVSMKDYKALNATLTSPAYLFVNHERIIEAAGLIGDENWLGLRAQLAGDDASLDQAA